MLDRYVRLLKNGGVVAFPTETVYGLGADARNPSAIKKVFDIKGRPADNPLIVHISSTKMAEEFAVVISEDAGKLMDHFWPGPLTLIFKKKPNIPDIITAGLDTVALRWPKHPLAQELIALAGPLVGPSANTSGKPSPTKARHVLKDFGEDFPVIEAGETDIGLESTVLDVSKEPYEICRPGAISGSEIEAVIGSKLVTDTQRSSVNTTPKSPGTKYIHYTPHADVQWLKSENFTPRENSLYLLHNQGKNQNSGRIIHYHQDYKKMAHELYNRFREADDHGIRTIFIEPFDEHFHQQSMVQALENRISKAIGNK